MTDTWSGNRPRKLTTTRLKAVRRRIGIPVRCTPRAHNEVSSTDSSATLAMAYGDDNPLYTDLEYAGVVGLPRSLPLYALNSGSMAAGGVVGGREGRDEGRPARGHVASTCAASAGCS